MSFSLAITEPATFQAKRLDAILAQGRTAPALAPVCKGDALSRIKAQLGSARN